MEINRTDSFTEWDKWKDTLSRGISLAEAVGMSDSTIEKIGLKVGGILSARVDPENREQRLLHELWKVGDDRERSAFTRMIIKMLQTDVRH